MGDTSEDGYESDSMRPEQRESIKTHVVDIMELEPKTIITHLLDNGTISFSEKESIFKTPGRQKRAKKLVELLLDGGVHTFAGFLHGLNKSSKNRLAAKLKTTAENIVNKSVQPLPSNAATTASLAVGTCDKNSTDVKHNRGASASSLQPSLPIEVPTQDVETELESEETDTTEEESKHVDDSFDIYETLKVANKEMKSQVDQFMPLVNHINQDGTERIQTELASHMRKVEEENARLAKSSQRDKQTFNRDMILLVINMNNVLNFMKDMLVNVRSSVENNAGQHKEKVQHMEAEITSLKSQLEKKEQDLMELQRTHQAFRVCAEYDVNKVVNKAVKTLKMAAEQQRRYIEEKDKRDREARKRELRRQKEEDAKRDMRKRKKEEKRKRREAEIKEHERLKLELEKFKRREEEHRKTELNLRVHLHHVTEERERDRVLRSSRTSTPNTPPGLFMHRTQVPKLPVIGKNMPRTPRKK